MTEPKKTRRDYGSGSIFERADGRFVGTIEVGWNANGKRRRIAVSGKTKAEVKRKLRDKQAEVDRGEVSLSARATVKAWADTWLPIKQTELSPQGFRALRGPVGKWIIPTIGHKRLASLTPADVRAIEDKQRAAGLKGTTCAATQRALFNMLRAAIAEGHVVPQRVLLAKTPATSESDRLPLTIPQALAVLAEASALPHGTRWAVALLCGMRQGECLGLTWDAVDFENQQIVVEWQLQRIPYLDKTDRSKGFRVPHEHQSRQVYKAWHLVKPKSKAGARVYPMLSPIAEALKTWQEVAPANELNLVWPEPDGRPRWHQRDLDEWHALQEAAGVSHPTGRRYHVHECRNVTATQLREVGADDMVITSLLGHTTISTSQGYMRVDSVAKRAALEQVAAMLELD